jgi:lipid A 4'-phosphatase
MLIALLAAAALFSLQPSIDLEFSKLFFLPDKRIFSGNGHIWVEAAYWFMPALAKAFIVLILLAFLASLFVRGERGRFWRIRTGFFLVVLAVGQGLVIDVMLKDYWNRARPHDVAEFGGRARFTPALMPSDQCDVNCSFVSGHAAAGFFLVNIGFLCGARARRRWTLAGLVFGGISGLARVSQGEHFLSDVVFAFFIVWFCAWLTRLIFNRLGWLPEIERI